MFCITFYTSISRMKGVKKIGGGYIRERERNKGIKKDSERDRNTQTMKREGRFSVGD